nr:putative integron gene cassette protein [uncultured bacterium]
MRYETKTTLKRLAKTVLFATFNSYFLVVLFVMFGPLYIGGDLAIRQAGKFTAMLAPFICIPTYLFLLRRDRNQKSIGL